MVVSGKLLTRFTRDPNVKLADDVGALTACIKGTLPSSFADVDDRTLILHGPWNSWGEVPNDLSLATAGRGVNPTATVDMLIVRCVAHAYFLVTINVPTQAQAGASPLTLTCALAA